MSGRHAAGPLLEAKALGKTFQSGFFARRPKRVNDPDEEAAAALVASLNSAPKTNGAADVGSQWLREGRESQFR